MNVLFREPVKKQLTKIPKIELKKIYSKIEKLSKNSDAGKNLRGNLEGYLSLRAWPYRIIYKIEKNSLIIYSVAHRQSAYK